MPNDPPNAATAAADATKRDEDAKKFGRWEGPFSIENVACHATLLPNKKVVCWSRRSNPMSPTTSMDEQRTNAFLIDVSDTRNPSCSYTKNQPLSSSDNGQSVITPKNGPISLFCSGHCLQPDGNLFVVGGHIQDGKGLQSACVYDYDKDLWTTKKPGKFGRWYPSALTMPDSSVLVMSGDDWATGRVIVSEVWRNDAFEKKIVPSPPGQQIPLYPRLHPDPFGQVFMTGPNEQSLFLDMTPIPTGETTGLWGPIKNELKRTAGGAENGASVTYDAGKVLWVGGGNGPPRIQGIGGPGNTMTEIIDLTDPSPKWTTNSDWNMKSSRRHHNLTVLPDGKVLATGGSGGDGFNDLRPGQPVHEAEMWDPDTKKWNRMAAEKTDRCYHGM